ncbi:MAG: ABC transporter substrate-binding protein, partial [Anaerolineae bacterium]
MRKRYRSVLLTLIVLCLLLAACGGGGEPTKGEVTIYVVGPLSGFQANGGQTVLGGARLAAEKINRAGGLLGYKINVIGLDDESDSDVAVDIAQEIEAAVDNGQ